MAVGSSSVTEQQPAPLRALDIRRALLAVLLDAPHPLSIADIVARLRRDHGLVLDGRQVVSGAQRVADMARYQTRAGRARRVGRGRYVGVPEAMSRSMRWRCRNWKLLHERWAQQAVAHSLTEMPSDVRNVGAHEALDDDQLLR